MDQARAAPGRATSAVRARMLDAAYELFSRRGIRAVGVNEIIKRAHVSKGTLYHHFASKDDLVIAFLKLREQRWTLAWVEGEARRRGKTPQDRLLAIFDLFDEWFHRTDFEACSFINVLLEMGGDHPAGRASLGHLANIRAVIQKLASEAGLHDANDFALSWHILMKGSIVAAPEGYPDAAEHAKAMAIRLIESHQEPLQQRSNRAATKRSRS